MVGPEGVSDLLASCVAGTRTAVSVADATDPELPLVYVNPAFERLTGYPAAQALGRNARFMQGPDSDPAAIRAMSENLRAGLYTRSRLINHRADGSRFWIDLHISPVHDERGRLVRFFAVQHDVTAEVLALDEAVEAAGRDPLTKLPNRAAVIAVLERELARGRRSGTSLAVLFLDVDGLKLVNDAHGHLVGDGYLAHVAECLRARLRGQDCVARVGGDEFIALVTDLPDDGARGTAQVVADLREALGRPFAEDGTEHRTSASIGVALSPRDGVSVRDLLAAADADMYRHKPGRRRRQVV